MPYLYLSILARIFEAYTKFEDGGAAHYVSEVNKWFFENNGGNHCYSILSDHVE